MKKRGAVSENKGGKPKADEPKADEPKASAAELATAAADMGIKETDVIYPYLAWNKVAPRPKVMLKRVHSRAWHHKRDQIKTTTMSPSSKKRQQTIYAKGGNRSFPKGL